MGSGQKGGQVMNKRQQFAFSLFIFAVCFAAAIALISAWRIGLSI
jgi:hypothetical protein